MVGSRLAQPLTAIFGRLFVGGERRQRKGAAMQPVQKCSHKTAQQSRQRKDAAMQHILWRRKAAITGRRPNCGISKSCP